MDLFSFAENLKIEVADLIPKSEADGDITDNNTDEEDSLGIPTGTLPVMNDAGEMEEVEGDEPPAEYDEYDPDTPSDSFDAEEAELELKKLGDISEHSHNIAKMINGQYDNLYEQEHSKFYTLKNTNTNSYANREEIDQLSTDFENALESLDSYIKDDLTKDSIKSRITNLIDYKRIFNDLHVLLTEKLLENK